MSDDAQQFRSGFDEERKGTPHLMTCINTSAFNKRLEAIEAELDNLPSVPKDALQPKIDSLVQRIHVLEKELTLKISLLPSYDARQCLESIKAMSERLSQLRVKLVPKQKFSFKSRKTVASPSPTRTPTTTASSPAATDTSAQSPNKTAIDESLFMKFENRSNEHLFIGTLPILENNGQPKDVALTNLTNCTINLVHSIPLGAIHVRNLKQCTLVIPPVSGSILLYDCQDCTLVGACHQSRMHTSSNMTIYLHVTSEPIIEDCTDMRFAPYGNILPDEQLDQLFQRANLDRSRNFYDRVKDFNWLRQQQSPNWRLLSPEEIDRSIADKVLQQQ
ncbi:hypothetical protein BGW41_004676 [Actinomortierella wolfii]|nr:hypothetical protein BGW41_004676 [Actinomortierella wolfii]